MKQDADGLKSQSPEPRTPSAQKVDPSVLVTDLYLQGGPRGSVPIDRTMRKPDAYYPAKPGPK